MYLHEEKTTFDLVQLVIEGPCFWNHVLGIFPFVGVHLLEEFRVRDKDSINIPELFTEHRSQPLMVFVTVPMISSTKNVQETRD